MDSQLEEFRKEERKQEVRKTPTYLRYELSFEFDDYEKKGGIAIEVSGGCRPSAGVSC